MPEVRTQIYNTRNCYNPIKVGKETKNENLEVKKPP